jgi:hypothetical protein
MARRIGQSVLAAALCALAAGSAAAPAFAHGGNPNYESIVRGVTPQIPGFSVEVLNGDDRLEVQNTGTSTVTIDGYSRDPYIRMSPDGTVEVNLRSPAYYLNQDRLYGTKVPASADPKAAPQWKVVEHSGRYEFHDHRMHWMSTQVPQQVTDKALRTKIVDWRVPLHAAGATGAIRGELFWRGAGPGAPIAAFVGLGAILLLGAASVVLVRRRRRDPGDPGDAGAPPAPRAPRGEAW